jgi:alkylation response protein AidB-like acyl-CoA dehydrogenase
MDFSYDDEQEALRDSVRGLLRKTYGDFEQRRSVVAADPGYDELLWQRLAELGVLGLPFAEEDGGMGAGPVETALVCEEIGRVLAPEPFLGAVVLAGGLVAAVGSSEQRGEILPALAEGRLLPAFAHLEPGERWQGSATGVTATQDGDAWSLHGVKEPVPHGAAADLLVVSARLPAGGTGLFLVHSDADGLTRTGYATHDGGRAAMITFTGTSATPLGEAGADRTDAIDRGLDVARVAAAHQALGAMSFALSTTTDYLRSRKQFGVTLNKFQALTFRAADMYVSLELARSTSLWASLVLDAGDAAAGHEAATRAALRASRSGRHIGQEAIQLHGGIGMTAEYSVGHYTSHLTALDHLFGDGRFHLAALAAGVGGHAEVDPLP